MVGVRAPQSYHHEPLHLLEVELAIEPLVRGFEDGSLAVELPHPRHQPRLARVLLVELRGAAAARDLQRHDAEAVHVRLPAGPARDDALRRQVAQRAGQHGGVRLAAVLDELGEAEVAELGAEGGVEHDVARLDVAVHHALRALLVEVEQRRREAQRDVVPRRPGEGRRRAAGLLAAAAAAVEVAVDAAVGHELVHQQEVAAVLVAPADEADEVAVAQLADDAHLRRVLLAPLRRALGHPLDRHRQTELLQEAPVHGAEAALPELPLVGEILGRRRKVAVPEPPRPALHEELLVGELVVPHLVVDVAIGELSGFPPLRHEPEHPYGNEHEKQAVESQHHPHVLGVDAGGELPVLHLLQLGGLARSGEEADGDGIGEVLHQIDGVPEHGVRQGRRRRRVAVGERDGEVLGLAVVRDARVRPPAVLHAGGPVDGGGGDNPAEVNADVVVAGVPLVDVGVEFDGDERERVRRRSGPA